MRFSKSLAILSFLALSAAAAKADPINIYSTGAGVAIGSNDAHYILTYVPYANNTHGYTAPNAIVTAPNAVYATPAAGTNWITPGGDARNGTAFGEQPAGIYQYSTIFTLAPNAVLSTAVLNLNLASDDSINVYLNYIDDAHKVATSNSYGSLNNFVINDSSNLFTTGMNALYFQVNNTGGPTGLYVQASGTISNTPEPSSLMLLGTGVLGVAGMARRKLARA